MINAAQEVIQKGFQGRHVPAVHVAVEAVTHVQPLGLLEQGLGVVQLANAEAAIGERHVRALAILGNLAKGRAGAALLAMAQVKVRVKIENADTRRRGVTAQVVGQPAETGEGDFMPPAQP